MKLNIQKLDNTLRPNGVEFFRTAAVVPLCGIIHQHENEIIVEIEECNNAEGGENKDVYEHKEDDEDTIFFLELKKEIKNLFF